jgi:glyoxylase-like metal-dependent hydrolase (beta-lactamase superfamily II)
VIITHGHTDYFGGAAYLQSHFGAADRKMMQPGGRGAAPPNHDMVIMEG